MFASTPQNGCDSADCDRPDTEIATCFPSFQRWILRKIRRSGPTAVRQLRPSFCEKTPCTHAPPSHSTWVRKAVDTALHRPFVTRQEGAGRWGGDRGWPRPWSFAAVKWSEAGPGRPHTDGLGRPAKTSIACRRVTPKRVLGPRIYRTGRVAAGPSMPAYSKQRSPLCNMRSWPTISDPRRLSAGRRHEVRRYADRRRGHAQTCSVTLLETSGESRFTLCHKVKLN